MNKKPARIPANVRKPRQITPEAPPAPTEYPLSRETVDLGAWIDSEESRLAEERARVEASIDGHRKALAVLQESLDQIAFQGHMVAASRHAREDSLRRLYGVDERWAIQGDKLRLVG